MNQIKTRHSHILIFIFAGSAFIYEMILASTLVLLFGDSIFYFSITIALFILFMGLGSSAARRLPCPLIFSLVLAELLISLAGAFCSLAILWVAGTTKNGVLTCVTALCFTVVIGFMAGIEIPLLYGLSEKDKLNHQRFGFLLMFDYMGALVGSLVFSFFLLPRLDLIGGSIATAIISLIILVWFMVTYRVHFSNFRFKFLSTVVGLILVVCAAMLYKREFIQKYTERKIFQISSRTEIKKSFRTHYQKVMVSVTPSEEIEESYKKKILKYSDVPENTPWISIYLNSYVQSYSPLACVTDFYHHAFVHPAMILAGRRERILILGGGDGLPAKEVEKYSEVTKITNVDLDGEWLNFARTDSLMKKHNFDSLNDPRIRIVIGDAFDWVRMSKEKYDVILVDFPEGVDIPLARSYSLQFLKDLKRLIDNDGVISFQVDFFNNEAYWVVVRTIREAGLNVIPHRAMEPKGDNYGLILVSKKRINLSDFEEKMNARSFIDSKLILSPRIMEQFRDDDFVQFKTKDLMVNTFFHPSFLYYYRASYPWEIFIGNN